MRASSLAMVLALFFATPALAALQEPLGKPYPAPEFAGLGGWINSKPLTVKGLKGKVVLVDFWTYSCINCIRTLPKITEWDAKYRDKGLVIVGVHAPEFKFEQNKDNITKAIANYKIKYPVAIDNGFATWKAYNNKFWPAHYLIDKQGQVVYTHFGEGKEDVMEHNIRTLLGLEDEAMSASTVTAGEDQTHETYLGYARADEHFDGAMVHDAAARYDAPKTLKLHHWTLDGGWKANSEHVVSTQADSKLKLHFKSKFVHLVLGSASGKPIPVTLTLDGKPLPAITVQDHKLYTLVELPAYGEGTLELTAKTAGLEAYAFTFGN